MQQCDLLPDNDLHPTEEREDLLDVLAQEARALRAPACLVRQLFIQTPLGVA